MDISDLGPACKNSLSGLGGLSKFLKKFWISLFLLFWYSITKLPIGEVTFAFQSYYFSLILLIHQWLFINFRAACVSLFCIVWVNIIFQNGTGKETGKNGSHSFISVQGSFIRWCTLYKSIRLSSHGLKKISLFLFLDYNFMMCALCCSSLYKL